MTAAPHTAPTAWQWLNSDARAAICLRYLALFAVSAGYFALLSLSSDKMMTWDGFYHIKYAEIMRTESLVPRIPWLPYTVGARLGVDHHWFFHVLQMPFTFGDLTVGLRLSSIAFAATSMVVIYWMLCRLRAPWPMLWTLLLLVGSELALIRYLMGRAGTFGISLLAVYLILLKEDRRIGVAVVAYLFMLSYGVSAVLLPISLLYAGIIFVQERRLAWQPVLFTALGLGLGLLINPNFPRNIEFTLFHTFMVLKETARGGEWYPLSNWQLISDSFPLVISAILALGLAINRQTRIQRDTWLICGTTVMFFVMTVRYQRFIEYWVPLVAVTNALLLRDAGVWATWQTGWPTRRRQLAGAVLVVAVALLATLRHQHYTARCDKEGFAPQRFAAVGAWLKQHSKPREVVFNMGYSTFSQLFFHNSHNYYVAGLDPGWLQSESLKRHEVYSAIVRGRYGGDYSQAIRKLFNARYVVGPRFYPLVQLLTQKGLTLRFASKHGFVFEVAQPSAE